LLQQLVELPGARRLDRRRSSQLTNL